MLCVICCVRSHIESNSFNDTLWIMRAILNSSCYFYLFSSTNLDFVVLIFVVVISLMNQHQKSLSWMFSVLFESRDQNIRNVVTLYLCASLCDRIVFYKSLLKTRREIAHWNVQNKQFITLTAFYFLKMTHPEIMICIFVRQKQFRFCNYSSFVQPFTVSTFYVGCVSMLKLQSIPLPCARKRWWFIWHITMSGCHPYSILW